MTSGRSATTGPSASPTPVPSRRPWWRMRSTTTRPPAPWSSTPWPAAGPRSTSASRWDADAWLTTSIPPDRRSAPTTSATACPPKPSAATSSSATLPITPCWPATTPVTASPPPPCPTGSPSSTTWPVTPSPALRPGGYLALLLAPQTEKDLPAGFGYLDHAFFGYAAATQAGFLPERRISCPMDGAYLPQHVRRAREEGRLLGQVRDLLVMRKPSRYQDDNPAASDCPRDQIPFACVNGRKPVQQVPMAAILASAILAGVTQKLACAESAFPVSSGWAATYRRSKRWQSVGFSRRLKDVGEPREWRGSVPNPLCGTRLRQPVSDSGHGQDLAQCQRRRAGISEGVRAGARPPSNPAHRCPAKRYSANDRASRRPVRRPWRVRRGWRGWGCVGRAAREAG